MSSVREAAEAIRELSGDVADCLDGGLPHDTLTYRGSLLWKLCEAAMVLQKAYLSDHPDDENQPLIEQQLAAARSEVARLKPQLESESEQAAERDHAAAHWFQQYREASADRKRAGEILLPQLTARLTDAERERPAGFSYTGITLHITKAEAKELADLLGEGE